VTPETFQAIKVPTLVMVGALDQVIPAERGAGFAQGVPGARLITYADGGHVPMEQLPARTVADLRAFLEALPPVP
jgi:pimeloyl-ACP methyl ester carboxylesterase